MGQNIKREIIDNIVVAMPIYITDQDTLSILDSVVSSELTKVNVQEITSLPAEWKTDTEKRNCYLSGQCILWHATVRSISRSSVESVLP